jgi:hypothetical protein
MSVEASRKHGPFDTRWPSGGTVHSAGMPSRGPLLTTNGVEGLDWDGFAARYVGGRHRHNFEALADYAAYRRGREWGSNGHPKASKPRLRTVPKDPLPPALEAAADAGAQRLLAAVAAVERWEWEGGSVGVSVKRAVRRPRSPQ